MDLTGKIKSVPKGTLHYDPYTRFFHLLNKLKIFINLLDQYI